MDAAEEMMAAGFYASISKQLKEKIRPWYPEVDQWKEADAIELCLAFNRAKKEIREREDFEQRLADHTAWLALRQGA